MTVAEFKKLERLADQAGKAVLVAQKKQIELEVLLSKAEYKEGNFTSHKTVDELFEELDFA